MRHSTRRDPGTTLPRDKLTRVAGTTITMNSDSDTADTVRGGSNGDTDTGKDIWGAKNSLRRHAGLDKKQRDSEVTPLLASGSSASDSTNNGRGDGGEESDWEGHADFEGLNWRHKPSVSCANPPGEWR